MLKQVMKLSAVVLAVTVAWCVIGCEDTSKPEAKYTIGFSQCTVKEPWRVLFNKLLIVSVICGLMVLGFMAFAYLGNRRIEKKLK